MTSPPPVTALPSVLDVAVVGAGPVGLSLAAALKQALAAGAAVAVIDPASPAALDTQTPRTVAIAEGPRRFLEHVGAWETIARNAEPVRRMEITDGEVGDAVRVTHLRFEANDGAPLAHMAFNDNIVSALAAVCDRLGVVRIEASVKRFVATSCVARLALDDGREIRARLAVGADGVRSKLRSLADIPVYGWDYDQSGLVATVEHECDHGGVAEQHFLPAGPFAILPLPGRRSSIVWNEPQLAAKALVKREPQEVVRELELRFTPKLGGLRLASRLEAFPLRFQIARRYVDDRLALIGDAAHSVHPLAGQGLNLGLRDVAALAGTIVREMRLGLDPGAPTPLRAYQRARRFDAAASGMGMDAMNRLFSSDLPPLRFVRDLGLRLVDRAPPLKDLLIGEAGGAGRSAPRLLRGLSL